MVLWILYNYSLFIDFFFFKSQRVTELIYLFYVQFFKQNRFGAKLIDILRMLVLILLQNMLKIANAFEYNNALTCK